MPSWDYPGMGEETRESQDAWTRGGAGYIVPSWDYPGIGEVTRDSQDTWTRGGVHCAILGLSWDGGIN